MILFDFYWLKPLISVCIFQKAEQKPAETRVLARWPFRNPRSGASNPEIQCVLRGFGRFWGRAQKRIKSYMYTSKSRAKTSRNPRFGAMILPKPAFWRGKSVNPIRFTWFWQVLGKGPETGKILYMATLPFFSRNLRTSQISHKSRIFENWGNFAIFLRIMQKRQAFCN